MNDSIWTIMSSLSTFASVFVTAIFGYLGYLQVRQSKTTGAASGNAASPSKPHVSRLLIGLFFSIGLTVISLVALVVTLTHASGAKANAGTLATPTLVSSPTSLLPTATNAPLPTATTTPLLSSNSFQDSLTANTNGWATSTQCSFPGDGLHVNAVGGGSAYWCQAPFHAVSDGAITVRARQRQGGSNLGFGIVFRAADGYHCYQFLITSGGEWAIDLVQGGQSIPLTVSAWMPTNAIHTGLNAENTLAIQASGQTIDLYINGERVSQQSDGTYGSGVTGLMAYGGAEVVFTNLSVIPS